MKSVELAYQQIASALVNVAEGDWQKIFLNCSVLGRGCGGFITTQTMQNGREADLPIGWGIFDIQTEAIYLRDNLLVTTGDRIWGLTFTLYPDGKFNIEYDYNKPEDYDESDEVITGDEINQSLSDLNNSKQST